MGIIPLKGRTLEVLSKDEVQQVHQAVLDLLENPGVKLEHDEALDLFQKAGADVDHENKMVHIPPSLVETALNHAPRFMTVCGKTPEHDLKSYKGVDYSSGHGATQVIDFETG